MSEFDGLGLGLRRLLAPDGTHHEYVMRQQPIHRILAFLGRSIDDVVNDPIAKNQVRGYFKLYKQIERSSEITELEKQWNSVG